QQAEQQELDPGTSERDRNALPPFRNAFCGANGQAAKRLHDNLAASAEDLSHPDVSKLVQQDREEDAQDPRQQYFDADVNELESEKHGNQPEPRHNADWRAEQAEAEVEGRVVLAIEQHGNLSFAAGGLVWRTFGL